MLEPCTLFKHEGQVVEIRGNIGGVNVVQALPDFGQFPLGNLVSAPDALANKCSGVRSSVTGTGATERLSCVSVCACMEVSGNPEIVTNNPYRMLRRYAIGDGLKFV